MEPGHASMVVGKAAKRHAFADRRCVVWNGEIGMDVYADARARGLVPDFFDARGEHRVTRPDALQVILDALPPHAAHHHLRGAIVLRPDSHNAEIALGGEPRGLSWRLVQAEQTIADGVVSGSAVPLPPDLDIGAYRLELLARQDVIERAPVLVSPQHAFKGSFDRVWLLTVQLYSLSSARNWGIGDFSDLARLIDIAAPLGCAGIGLNPLHALFDDRPEECSPYAPNSRLFLNPLYIDIDALPEFAGGPVDRDAIAREKQAPLINYRVVAQHKFAALRHAFAEFSDRGSAERHAAFAQFRRDRGMLLQRFACFEVLRRKFNAPWWQWPDEWRRPDDARIRQHRESADRDELEFVEFVQWCGHDQLQRCAELAAALGMTIGLYLDVAVGVQSGGFDAWAFQDTIARNLAVGAPPDLLNVAGQDWGICGFTGSGLLATDFESFREMLRGSLRYAGAIRLDHILGLNRLYLVPAGFSPRDGAYVEMPLQALLAVVAQESEASACVIVGEDLGTVPHGFRETMADWGIFSYRVMLFERDHDGAFLPADRYAANALVTFNTHDLAAFAGWRWSHDLTTKRALGLDPGESDDARRHAHWALQERLKAHGIARDDFLGVVQFLSDTPSRMLAIALDDLLGLEDQPNIPGTIDEHPNWRRRLPVKVEDIANRLGPDFAQAVASRRE
jgi:4-alpha-glucanotransferase